MPRDESTPEIPEGFCQCGCGGHTAIANHDWPAYGHVKGKPKRFLRGHNARISTTVDWIKEDRGYETPCWIWQRGKTTNGYANAYPDGFGSPVLGHRLAYERVHGPIPPGMQIDHLCRQRDCVNPDHLEIVTNTVNTQRGGRAKLTPESVREIRRLAATHSRHELGRMFGVHHMTICGVVNGLYWRNILDHDDQPR